MKAPSEGIFRFWPRFWPNALSLRSMRGRMAALLGIAMLPAGAIAMQVGFNAVSVRQAAYADTLTRRALQSIAPERAIVEQFRSVLRVLATSPDLQRAGSADCSRWLTGVAAEYPFVASIGVTTDDGRILCSIPAAPSPLYRAPQTGLRRLAAARNSFTMGYVPFARLANGPVLAGMQPILDSSGHRIGFISASVRLSTLREILDRSHNDSGARLAIVDATGQPLVTSSLTSGETAPALPTPAQIDAHRNADLSYIPVRGGDAVLASLSAPDLYLTLSWPPSEPYWQRVGGYAVSIAAPLLIWILAIAAGWFVIEIYIARPLSMLETAARGFARGEEAQDTESLASAPEEIRSLRRTMAAMAKTLKGRETRLMEALAEERVLLREVHHRVKNNLQMVASLLSIQARAAKDQSEAWGLARAHDRVQMLALVHQRIYASGEVRDLRLDDLATEITRQLVQSRGAKINLALDVAPARADIDRAVPLAFLFGEGVSAALDALGENGGALRLSLHQNDTGDLRIAIEADAIGPLVESVTGGRLIEAFARQLGAQLGFEAERPFALWISVPPAKQPETVSA